MTARSLQHMISSIRDVLHHARNDEIRSGLEAAIRTLEWLSKGEDVLKMLIEMRRERPELFRTIAEILRQFPGAEIDKISEAA